MFTTLRLSPYYHMLRQHVILVLGLICKLREDTNMYYLWDFFYVLLKEHASGGHTWNRHVVELPRQRNPWIRNVYIWFCACVIIYYSTETNKVINKKFLTCIVKNHKNNLWTHMNFWSCAFNFSEKWTFLRLTLSKMSKPHTVTLSLLHLIFLSVWI